MRKKGVIIVVLAVAILFTMSFTCVAAEKVFHWKYQQMRLASEPGMAYYTEMFEKTLPAMTNGRLKIKMFWAGDLVKSADSLDAVKSGVVDMIGMPSIYFKGVIPEASIEYGLPFGIRTPGEMYNFMYGKKLPNQFGGWRAIDLLRKVYAKHGVYYLAGGADCWPASLMFNSPINSLADLKGKKVRASGLMITWVERLGGQGVYIPGEEAYQRPPDENHQRGHLGKRHGYVQHEVSRGLQKFPLSPHQSHQPPHGPGQQEILGCPAG
jgi:TRAP-type mannitol/chloroaromatic compound transport system substrate-binding protein